MKHDTLINQGNINYYFGINDTNLILSCYIFGIIGVVIMVLLDVMSRNDKNDIGSPAKFSWEYFWKDNVLRILLNFIVMFVAIRFLPDLINQPITQFHALVIGILSDKIAVAIKNKKDKFIQDGGLGNIDSSKLTQKLEITDDKVIKTNTLENTKIQNNQQPEILSPPEN